ncbi:hypothetical protein YYC_02871 [Plasmodium yoelii 17X]|uniref:Fam-a protein n=3 Tax=Plasmodium yoelii TaxID=5861 RepID=A0AAE9WQ73_PLAYO|nr:fam-a protein [Plasmodium yoelii]ETB59353.1 hypothetical protein YYC_02871 [Plasmodium yoelii 17X]WBY58233.1 fam-a protein [Plasmodium yoelii yoelii]CDU85259.1 fam-a protein [Plasmodium yoelii]VTZ79154.1 fam-a protein [Plasmodium yoelii]|eukprot:XP_022813422.1 fam-a protein [Plasmodium yoelii]
MNKFYIQIVFFLLTISVYVNNKTHAAEPAPGTSTPPTPTHNYPTSEEIYKKHKHLLCTNPKETKRAVELMNEAITHFKHHSICLDDYEPCERNPNSSILLFKKYHEGHTRVEKIEYKVYDPNEYNDAINKLWDPDNADFFNASSVKRKIIRVYNPNLVLIQQRYKTWFWGKEKYFYALITRFEISKYITLIVMTSVNVNDHNPSNKEYKNTIIENANSFKIDIDSEDDIRKGKLKKTFVNLAGYYFQKYNSVVDVTYISSINGHACI